MKDIVSVVITAAGNGTRMKTHKILMPINGKSVLWHTLSRFKKSSFIDEIVVVAKEEDMKTFEKIAKDLKIKIKIALGGKERVESLLSGIKVSTGTIIITHDGCRPFTPVTLIDELIKMTKKNGAAMTAVNPTATMKYSKNGFIENSFSRKDTWIAQTPQGFRRDIILRAAEKAVKNGYFVPTDDSELAIKYTGAKVFIVPGDDINIKITYPKDTYIAEKILEVST
ncbi:2-C-methyl-D-erythritol 4-phosphate cytidylyltransferase [Candidatus Roizmanbacteria bacterium CG17_big_fil_post_rev_8_21_14_2_50_39_7]|uniref:2-C-methyl-D-erythritol 4-phosphate cytidylyltransferase n=1 Tax=Candidatus Roizmanbacteria bacterium CG17_big_fil_post_rev_8_21_14_2_50_39_7 TaxID=1974858 RepID=A0A2M7EKY0_9BACT|nr:MAG: 2-C-methyl-D-erythritol 4-phosphate cytidylyltransferase [Candidatus Roizmanbacteria bacterium CG17_big_fil_post_rev_8_21_14_2_50_39_7]